jgi:hypothetical protein
MRWLLAVCASCSLFALVAIGAFLPLRDAGNLQYIFVWRGAAASALAALVVSASIAAAYTFVALTARRAGPASLATARTGRWLAPLAAIGILSIGILPAVPGVGERGAPVAYFLYELRWWWVLTLGAWALWRGDAVAGHPIWRRAVRVSSWSSPAQLLLADASLFVLVMVWAIATTPLMRFSGAPFGDEPRYLRYCESWYQGHGCDMAHNTPMAEEQLDASPHVFENLRLLVGALRDEAVALPKDLRDFARDPTGFRWNRVPDSRFGFVTGKTGAGMYALHQPGLSVVLFPGYFLDRYLLGLVPGYQGEFPEDLPLTTLTVLLTLAAATVALFRLLRHALGSAPWAWAGAAVGGLSFPASAFAFQIYPEVVAMFLSLLAVTWVLAHAPRADVGVALSAAAGAAAGALLWLHPRFLLIAAVIGLAGAIRARGRARVAFSVAFLLLVFTLGLYDYHITGSWMPNALYVDAEELHQIIWANVPDNLIAYAFHGVLGLLPHAPWLWAVLPGLAVLARREPKAAASLVILTLALGVPAAGHALDPAGGTPGRFVAAIVPLLIWPAMVALRHLWHSATVRVIALFGLVLSLHASLAYNWNHEKSVGRLIAPSMSGWTPNLAFPTIRNYFERPWPDGYGVFLAMMALLVVATALAWRTARAGESPEQVPRSYLGPAVAVMVLVSATSTAASAAIGQWTRDDFFIADATARRQAGVALLAQDRCALCFASTRRSISWRWLGPSPIVPPRIGVYVDGVVGRVEVEFSDHGIDGLCRVTVTFGDGTRPVSAPVPGRNVVYHTYVAPGTYRITTEMEMPRGLRVDSRDIAIEPVK